MLSLSDIALGVALYFFGRGIFGAPEKKPSAPPARAPSGALPPSPSKAPWPSTETPAWGTDEEALKTSAKKTHDLAAAKAQADAKLAEEQLKAASGKGDPAKLEKAAEEKVLADTALAEQQLKDAISNAGPPKKKTGYEAAEKGAKEGKWKPKSRPTPAEVAHAKALLHPSKWRKGVIETHGNTQYRGAMHGTKAKPHRGVEVWTR